MRLSSTSSGPCSPLTRVAPALPLYMADVLRARAAGHQPAQFLADCRRLLLPLIRQCWLPGLPPTRAVMVMGACLRPGNCGVDVATVVADLRGRGLPAALARHTA